MRDGGRQKMDIGAAVFSHSWFIALCTIAGLLGGLSVSYLTTPIYVADSTILYRFGREYFPIAPGEAQRNWGENIPVALDTALNTEMRLLQSRAVREAVVQGLGARAGELAVPSSLDQLLSLVRRGLSVEQGNQEPSADRAIDRLRDLVLIQRVGGSLILTVTGRSQDPNLAELLVSSTINAYLTRRKSLFFDGSTEFYREQIEDAEAKLRVLDVEMANLTEVGGLDEIVRQRQALAERLKILEEATSTPEDEAASVQARQVLARLFSSETRLRGLEIRRSAAASRLERLIVDANRSALDTAFADQSNRRIEIVDAAHASDRPLGLSLMLRTLLGGFIGFALSVAAAILLHRLTTGRLEEPPHPGRFVIHCRGDLREASHAGTGWVLGH